MGREEDASAILELLSEFCRQYNECLSACVFEDGRGWLYNDIHSDDRFEILIGYRDENEPAGGNRTGSGE